MLSEELAMKLTKYKIRDLIKTVDELNYIGIKDFFGININKEFMPTMAKTEGLDEKKYKLVKKIDLYIVECKLVEIDVYGFLYI